MKELNAAGKLATIDVLGEEISREDEARTIAQAYRGVFAEIERERLDSNVSVKLTALGLHLSYDLCRENLEAVLREAATHGNFVRIDMEDSTTTDETLRLYRELRESGHDNVGVVLQAYLRRTLDDVRDLADLRPNVRLCKGIYVEPSSIAYTDHDAVRASYVRCLDALLDAGAYVGVATHDEWLIGEALARIGERALRAGGLRVPDAARRTREPGSAARRGRAPAAGVRAVRGAVVRVLAPPSPGEPRDGGDDRARDARPRDRPRLARRGARTAGTSRARGGRAAGAMSRRGIPRAPRRGTQRGRAPSPPGRAARAARCPRPGRRSSPRASAAARPRSRPPGDRRRRAARRAAAARPRARAPRRRGRAAARERPRRSRRGRSGRAAARSEAPPRRRAPRGSTATAPALRRAPPPTDRRRSRPHRARPARRLRRRCRTGCAAPAFRSGRRASGARSPAVVVASAARLCASSNMRRLKSVGSITRAARSRRRRSIVCPRIISASGEDRNETAAAMSSGAASLPAGVRSTVRSISSLFGKNSSASVSTTPPETALARIPSGPSSTAR